jgi:hypothetical protein
VGGLHIGLLVTVKAIDIVFRTPRAWLAAIASGTIRISKEGAL